MPPLWDGPSGVTGNGLRFIYSTREGGGAGLFEYNNGMTGTIVLTNTGNYNYSPNGLATNRDDNLIYFADSQSASASTIYAYDYVAYPPGTGVASDIWPVATLSDPIFLTANGGTGSATGEGGPLIISNNTGATYHNNVYYLAGQGSDTDGYYRIVLAPFVPGSTNQQVLDAHYIKWSDSKDDDTREMGDIAYNHNSGMLMVSSNQGSGNLEGTISLVDPSTGVVKLSKDLDNVSTNNNATFQIVWDASGSIVLSDSGNDPEIPPGNFTGLRTLNCQSGYATDPISPALVGTIWDLAEWITYPCGPTA